ncbi:hypothetical protein FKM82_023943 [Ascaphus truei]
MSLLISCTLHITVPYLWNSLTLSIQYAKRLVPTFKTNLKTYVFNEAFQKLRRMATVLLYTHSLSYQPLWPSAAIYCTYSLHCCLFKSPNRPLRL